MLIETRRLLRRFHLHQDDAVPDHVDEPAPVITLYGAFELATRIPNRQSRIRGNEVVQERLGRATLRIRRITPLGDQHLEALTDFAAVYPHAGSINRTSLRLAIAPGDSHGSTGTNRIVRVQEAVSRSGAINQGTWTFLANYLSSRQFAFDP